jgi:L-threonylcarbamoyladenylate synthase
MEDDLLQSLIALEEGGTILYPTDTVWGIGCDATNPKAVEKVFQIKKRPADRSFLVLIDSEENLHRYMEKVPEVTWDILKSVTTPLTIVYPNAKNLAKKCDCC